MMTGMITYETIETLNIETGSGADDFDVIDTADNLYVGGHTWGGGGSSDFLLIKYDGSGNELWRALYDGPGNDYDILGGLGLDSLGNAYVTGYVMVDGSFDFATVKYEP